MKNQQTSNSSSHPLPSSFVLPGGELHLSNPGQLELLRGMVERGVPLRTTVRGSSMSPFIRDEDVLTIAPMHARALRVGEVVAFVQPDTGRLAIHRIIARMGADWLVRGDNCLAADGVVARESIIGRVTRVERQGRVVRFGLGGEMRVLAWLVRGEVLLHIVALWYFPRRVVGFALRRAQALPWYRALGRRLRRGS